MNLDLYERLDPPIDYETAPMRRGLINDIAFHYFVESSRVEQGLREPLESAAILDEVTQESRNRLSHLERNPNSLVKGLDDTETADVLGQASRLKSYLISPAEISKTTFEPLFPGCGFLDTCTGDVLVSETLFEVKAGERAYRSTDIRQLLTYAALNSVAHKKYTINFLALVNPRQGTEFVMDVETLCEQISGKSSTTIFGEIVMALSSGDISR